MSLLAALAISALAAAALILAVVIVAQLLDGATSVTGLLRCAARGNHDPERDPATGGFRCSRCGLTGADLGAFNVLGGVEADGYVEPQATTYDRDSGEITRSVRW